MAKETSISETIKAAAEAEAQKEDEVAKAASLGSWGGFKVETGFVPKRGGTGTSKYDWSSFPAPSNPDDSATWTSVLIPGIGNKTISTSIAKYRKKLQEAGEKNIPEFTVSVNKDKDGKPDGVRVIRKK